MYPPRSDAEGVPSETAGSNAASYFLWVTVLIGGILNLVNGTDIPFGVVQISGVAGGALLFLAGKRRTFMWAIIAGVVVVVTASGIAEIRAGHKIWGAVILAYIPLLLWMGCYRDHELRSRTPLRETCDNVRR